MATDSYVSDPPTPPLTLKFSENLAKFRVKIGYKIVESKLQTKWPKGVELVMFQHFGSLIIEMYLISSLAINVDMVTAVKGFGVRSLVDIPDATQFYGLYQTQASGVSRPKTSAVLYSQVRKWVSVVTCK